MNSSSEIYSNIQWCRGIAYQMFYRTDSYSVDSLSYLWKKIYPYQNVMISYGTPGRMTQMIPLVRKAPNLVPSWQPLKRVFAASIASSDAKKPLMLCVKCILEIMRSRIIWSFWHLAGFTKLSKTKKESSAKNVFWQNEALVVNFSTFLSFSNNSSLRLCKSSCIIKSTIPFNPKRIFLRSVGCRGVFAKSNSSL